MKTRSLRLVLAAAALTVATGPLVAPAHATACNDAQFPEVCAAFGAVCRATDVTRTVCSQFG